ncbi:TPA: hypothetical protein OGT30_001151 [Escherichia coli]|nr:hypothetical protein [Escherichia coli]
MRSWFCLIALLLPGIVFASGEVIIQPQSKGEVHFLARGLSSGGDNIISAAYSAGRPLSVLFSPTGNGHCEGDFWLWIISGCLFSKQVKILLIPVAFR